MPSAIQWALILIGSLTAGGLIWLIRGQLRMARTAAHPVAEVHTPAQQAAAIDSMAVLIRCVLAAQMDPIEACLRIHHLLDHVDTTLRQRPDLQIFSDIAAATAHMPTHHAREQTDVHFLRKLDQQRHAIAQTHYDAIVDGCRHLQQVLSRYSSPS